MRMILILRTGLVMAVLAVVGVTAGPQPALGTTVGAGHVDLVAPRWVADALTIEARLDGAGGSTWHPPGDVVVEVGPHARVLVPDDPAYGFLGPPGATAWVLPQSPIGNLPWVGWSTEALPVGVLDGDRIQMSLLGVSGPGAVFVYRSGSLGAPAMVFAGGGSISLTVGAHAHANWAFTAPGTYALTFRVSGTSGGLPVAATGTYRVEVLGAPLASPGPPGLGSASPAEDHGVRPAPSAVSDATGSGSGEAPAVAEEVSPDPEGAGTSPPPVSARSSPTRAGGSSARAASVEGTSESGIAPEVLVVLGVASAGIVAAIARVGWRRRVSS